MKKTLLLLSVIASLASHQMSAQTISVTGSSGTIDPSTTSFFDATISLSVSSNVGDVTALNLLLATPTSGATSGAPYFTVQYLQGSTSFPTRVGSGAVSMFDTPTGSGPNAGFTVSTPSNDLGSSGPGLTSPFSNVAVDILRFTIDPNTPAGTYEFRATLGFPTDFNGSFINIAGGNPDTLSVNDAPIFTVTVVPEPSTWALIAVGGMASVGMTIFRRRKN